MNNFLKYFNKSEYEELRKMDNMYLKAKLIVKRVFRNVLDKGGHSYLNHLYYVSDCADTMGEKITGLLHDIIEDSEITEEDLKKINFSDDIITAVSILTKKKLENYNDYIDRIINSNNSIALKVKRIDMENNMDLSRIENPTEKDYKRRKEKYIPQYQKIIKVIEKRREKNVRY